MAGVDRRRIAGTGGVQVSPADGITPRVRTILSQILGVPAEAIGPEFSADSAAEWTSLNHLMLVSQIESEFGA